MTALDTFATVVFSDITYCDNANVFFIEVPHKDEITLYALSAIINSTIYSVLTRSIANPQSNGYFKFNKQFLEPVPFPCTAFSENGVLREQLANAAKDIKNLQLKFKTSSLRQKRTYERMLLTKWKLVDDICYQLYNLTEDEINFFKNRGRNIDRIDILN